MSPRCGINFALNDNNYITQIVPSTPGALNLISGQTNGSAATKNVFVDPREAFGDALKTIDNTTEISDGDPLGESARSGHDGRQ